MRWTPGRRSAYLEDRRGRPGRGMAVGAGVGVPAVVATVLVTMCTAGGGGAGGVDLGSILGQLGAQAAPAQGQGSSLEGAPDPDAELVDFMNFLIEDVQAAWEPIFEQAGRRYEPTTLVLFEQGTETGCGYGTEAVGPFYCPADRQVYVDLDFFRELSRRFGAPGDFAQAYVIAHEVGHHVQNVLGISDQVRQAQQASPEAQNDLSIRLELQADCFAGVWGYTAYDRDLLEGGDLEEGLRAAAAVGDDAIQESAGARVNPETWTHGSSEQRATWFRSGFEAGSPDACDTFAA